MTTLLQKLYTNQKIRQLESIAIDTLAISSYQLMQRAGKAAFNELLRTWPKVKNIVVFCGGGNNGGDGYVVATLAHQAALKVDVFYLVEPWQLKDAALSAYQDCLQSGVSIRPFNKDYIFSESTILVDGLLGTGLQNTVKENYQTAIHWINTTNFPVLALDTPSGLNTDTGQIQGCCVKATVTVTFIALKQGLFTGVAPDYTGKIILADLELSHIIFTTILPSAEKINFIDLKKTFLSPRKLTAHKGDFGHVFIIGGDYGMAGAIRMAGEACARVGAGLTTLITQPEHVNSINTSRPELMVYGCQQIQELLSLLKKATIIAIGPGLGQSLWSKEFFNATIKLTLPMVIDADGLNLLARHPHKKDNWILTPHVGEAARLLNTSVLEIQNDRYAAVKKIQATYGGICVLKGAGSLICDSTGQIFLCDKGNPGMATGGMGDVLTGIIAGLLSQNITLVAAAQIGVYLHALAADDAAREFGQRGLLALDVLPYLRKQINE